MDRRAERSGETKALRARLAEAFAAADPEAAWYLDRVRLRLVEVRHGVTDVPDVTAEDVEDDELRYLEVPVVRSAQVHLWMEEFVAAQPDLAPLLDERKGANRRFETGLAAHSPEALATWRAFRRASLDREVAAWLDEIGVTLDADASSD